MQYQIEDTAARQIVTENGLQVHEAGLRLMSNGLEGVGVEQF